MVKGDTLWGIAGKFLKEPWRWPEIWQINRPEIKNPHRIYPGDIVVLDLSGGNPRLRIARPVKFQPGVFRGFPPGDSSIPPHVIEPFISRPWSSNRMPGQRPRIVATQEDRVFVGNGDTAFVSSITGVDKVEQQMYRPVQALKDPDTQEILGYEAFFLGDAKLISPAEPAVIRMQKPRRGSRPGRPADPPQRRRPWPRIFPTDRAAVGRQDSLDLCPVREAGPPVGDRDQPRAGKAWRWAT